MTIPVKGEIWVDQHGTEVQVVEVKDYGITATRVVFVYLSCPTGVGLNGVEASSLLKSFVTVYSPVDLFSAQNPKVVVGQIWWNRRSPRYTAKVVSVLNGVVTFKHGESEDEYDARTIENFITTFTNMVSAPKDTTDLSEWPTHVLIKFNDQSNTLHFHSWAESERNPRQTYPDMALLRVPIDWSQAVWEVEPK